MAAIGMTSKNNDDADAFLNICLDLELIDCS